MTVANAQHMLDHWRERITGLAQQTPEVKRQTLMAVLKEAHLGLGKDIRMVFWPLGSGGDGGGGLARPHPTDPDQGPTTTGPEKKTTIAVGSEDGRVWRRLADSNRRYSIKSTGH